jgi:hypothetical protein
MNLEEALRAHLLTVPEVVALVGTRVYVAVLPQTVVLPAITYQRISSPPVTHRGDPTLTQVRMQVDGWAEGLLSNYDTASALRAAIRAGMKTFRREAAPRVTKAILRDKRDLRDPASNRWRVSLDFMIWVEE